MENYLTAQHLLASMDNHLASQHLLTGVDNPFTPQHLLTSIEARCGAVEMARMLRLRLAIAQAGSTACRGDERPAELLAHWLDVVCCERSDELAELHEREAVTRVLVQWLDEQRSCWTRTHIADPGWSVLDPSTCAAVQPPVRAKPLTLRGPLVAARGDLRRWWDHFERVDPAVHARGRELARDGVYGLGVGYLRGSARVTSGSGSFYIAAVRWRSGLAKSPRTVTPTCSCPDRRRWCKHSIAVTYHLVERCWRTPAPPVR